MPYLKIQTNQKIDEAAGAILLSAASKMVAAELGKPESYVMVGLETEIPMLFAGSDTPLAYLELKSIGLPEGKTTKLSAALSKLMAEALGVSQERVYIEFANAKGLMWGWNGGTF